MKTPNIGQCAHIRVSRSQITELQSSFSDSGYMNISSGDDIILDSVLFDEPYALGELDRILGIKSGDLDEFGLVVFHP